MNKKPVPAKQAPATVPPVGGFTNVAPATTTMKTPEVIKRLPYPQTIQSARTFIVANGLSVSQLARHNDLPRLALQDLLRPNGQLKGMRGQAHLAAIVLGLKPAPDTAAANDPSKLPRRKNEAQARRAAA